MYNDEVQYIIKSPCFLKCEVANNNEVTSSERGGTTTVLITVPFAISLISLFNDEVGATGTLSLMYPRKEQAYIFFPDQMAFFFNTFFFFFFLFFFLLLLLFFSFGD